MKGTRHTYTKEPKKTERPDVKPAVGELVPQAHGGAISYGNRPGQTPGGIGRPRSELRARLRGSFEERVHILEELAADPDCSPSDRIKALELMLRYGLGTQSEHEVRTENIQIRGDLSEALKSALRDPGVRQWLEERSDIRPSLPLSMHAGEQQIEDAEFELLPSVPLHGEREDE